MAEHTPRAPDGLQQLRDAYNKASEGDFRGLKDAGVIGTMEMYRLLGAYTEIEKDYTGSDGKVRQDRDPAEYWGRKSQLLQEAVKPGLAVEIGYRTVPGAELQKIPLTEQLEHLMEVGGRQLRGWFKKAKRPED